MKKIVLATSALMALSGCLDDTFDYGGSGNSGTTPGLPVGGEVTQIYGEGSTGAFAMQATDKDDATADVDGQENSALSNIQVIGDYQNQGALNVTVTESAKASIQLFSNSGIDLAAPNSDGAGTLIFDVKVNEHTKISADTSKVNPITVTLLSDGSPEASVDITSSINAFLGSPTQSVRLPLNCFSDQGVDFSKTTQPFSMKVNSDINFDISNIRFQAESGGDKPGSNLVVDCYKQEKKEILTDDISTVFEFDGAAKTGWARFQPTTATGLDLELSGVHFKGITSVATGTKNSFLGLILDEEKLKDLSLYLEHGKLEFDFYADSNSATAHPTGNVMVKMETPNKPDAEGPAQGEYGYPTSQLVVAHNYNSDPLQEVRKVSLPLKQFFTNTDGNIDINALKYVKKVVIFPELVDKAENYNPGGMTYYVADVKLVMNP
ncbi:putative glycoside hydrolase [Photobacterium sagamiensis]|uniref:putative glycoside hydrolase n=1 Tax=Photobacterium sagamiensis TaxID=2910241 RepID=UPI003D13D9F2